MDTLVGLLCGEDGSVGGGHQSDNIAVPIQAWEGGHMVMTICLCNPRDKLHILMSDILYRAMTYPQPEPSVQPSSYLISRWSLLMEDRKEFGLHFIHNCSLKTALELGGSLQKIYIQPERSDGVRSHLRPASYQQGSPLYRCRKSIYLHRSILLRSFE